MKSNERWADLKVSLPGKINPAFIRRRLFAENKATRTIPEQIFNIDNNGTPARRRSLFRFGGGQHFHIYAVGDRSSNILESSISTIRQTLEHIYQTDIEADFSSDKYVFSVVSEPIPYKISGLALIKSPDDYEIISKLPQHKLASYINSLLRNHIDREISLVDAPGITMDNPDIFISRPSIKSADTVSLKPGSRFLVAKEVHFETNLYIKGILHAGYLLSHGYGRIRKSNPIAPQGRYK